MSTVVGRQSRSTRLRAVLSLALVTFTLSESLFWGQWSQAYGRGPVEVALTYLAYLVVVVVVLAVLQRTHADGVRGLVLAGALLGWLVEGVVVQTTYEELPFSVAFTALAWHALVTVVVGWWGIQVVVSRSPRTAVLAAVSAGAAWGLWSAWMAQDPDRTLPADGLDAFAGYVLVTLVLLVVGILGWQTYRGPALVSRPAWLTAAVVLGLAAVVTTMVVPFAPLVLVPLLALTVVAMRRSPGADSVLGSPTVPAARLVGSAGLAGLAAIATYAAAQAWGGPTAELWGYTVYITTSLAGLVLWCRAVLRGVRPHRSHPVSPGSQGRSQEPVALPLPPGHGRPRDAHSSARS